jgi:hypothetical protein
LKYKKDKFTSAINGQASSFSNAVIDSFLFQELLVCSIKLMFVAVNSLESPRLTEIY